MCRWTQAWEAKVTPYLNLPQTQTPFARQPSLKGMAPVSVQCSGFTGNSIHAVVAAKTSTRLADDTVVRINEKNTMNNEMVMSLEAGFETKYKIRIEMLGNKAANSVLIALAILSSLCLG